MLILKNGWVVPVTGPSFQGDVLVRDGKIEAVGAGLTSPEAQYVDVEGYTVIPGLIDAHSHIGLAESGVGDPGQDVNEHTDPVLPELRGIDSLNPNDDAFRESREAGVTACAAGPGSSGVITGQFCAVKTWGRTAEDMVIQAPLAMKLALGENPKQAFGIARKTAPETRMSEMALLRKVLREAAIYAERKGKQPEQLPWDSRLEPLVPVIKGELPVKVHVHRADDIMSALRLAREFSLRMSLEHCTEGNMVLSQLQDAVRDLDVRLVLGPLMMPRRKIETQRLDPRLPGELHRAGLRFGLMSDHPVTPQRYLNVYAGLAAREGLPEEAALAAITIDAAHACWLEDRIGSLTVGKDADIAVFQGNPLSLSGRCVMTIINGQIVFDRSGRRGG